MLVILAFVAYRFVTVALVTEILLNDAFVDRLRVILILVILAFIDNFI